MSVCLSSVTYCLFQTLVFSLVLTRLDYGNSALAGLLVYLVRRLQSVLNAAVRLTYDLRRSDHMTATRWSASIGCASMGESESSLRSPYWHTLFRLLHTCRRPTQSTIAAFCRHQLHRLVVPTSIRLSTVGIAELFRSPARRHGMTSRKTWHQQNHWPHFVACWRHTCSGSLFGRPILSTVALMLCSVCCLSVCRRQYGAVLWLNGAS